MLIQILDLRCKEK